jgi:uncharacterized protein (DUF2164 family)
MNLTDERRNDFLTRLQSLFYTEFDEDLSDFRAEAILDLALEMLGPTVYNQAVQDARAYFQTKLDDLDGEVHAPET